MVLLGRLWAGLRSCWLQRGPGLPFRTCAHVRGWRGPELRRGGRGFGLHKNLWGRREFAREKLRKVGLAYNEYNYFTQTEIVRSGSRKENECIHNNLTSFNLSREGPNIGLIMKIFYLFMIIIRCCKKTRLQWMVWKNGYEVLYTSIFIIHYPCQAVLLIMPREDIHQIKINLIFRYKQQMLREFRDDDLLDDTEEDGESDDDNFDYF